MALEYRSKQAWRGVPVVHVALGGREVGGRYRPGRALGVIAVGDRAVGVIAVGLIAIGPVSMGLVTLGVVALGGVAVGVVAAGVIAVGTVAAGVIAAGRVVAGVRTLGMAAALATHAGEHDAKGHDAEPWKPLRGPSFPIACGILFLSAPEARRGALQCVGMAMAEVRGSTSRARTPQRDHTRRIAMRCDACGRPIMNAELWQLSGDPKAPTARSMRLLCLDCRQKEGQADEQPVPVPTSSEAKGAAREKRLA